MDGSAWSMHFSHGGLRELIRAANRQRASGCLRITTDSQDSAALAMLDGEIYAVFFNSWSGPSALSRLMLCGPGQATVDPVAPVYAVNIAGQTADLLARIERVLAETASAPDSDHTDQPTTSIYEPKTQTLSAADLDAAFEVGTARSDDPEMTMRTSLLPPQVGSLLGRCLIKRQLGEGASSIVYLAHHTALDVDVVVKVLMPSSGGSDAVALTTNEARILARLNHPNILRVFDYDDQGRFAHLVVEYVPGGSLHDRILSEGTIDSATAVSALRQAVKALVYAHARIGLVHGDIKPHNILMADDGRIRLIDFGIAAIHDGRERFSTAVRSQVRGTPAYLAPELVDQPRALCWASDCYALGATIYHALTGKTLYTHDDPLQLMLQHATAGYVPLNVACPELDPRVVAIVHRCLQLRPNERFASPGALLAEIEALDGEHAAGASAQRRTTLWQHVAQVLRRA